MFAQNNEDEKEDVSSSEASDVGEIESFESESESDSEDVADSGIVSGSSDKSEGSDNEVAAFDKKLAQALRTRPGDGDSEADDSSSSDSDMNDEEMEALDEPLAKIFREHQNLMSKKNEKKNAKETVINLKCRVLELMGIYVKQQSSNSLALGLLVPVLAVIRTTTSPLVSSKACELIREYSKLCKRNGLPQVEDFEAMFDLLEEVHAEAGREASNAHASACSQASLLIVRALVSRDREHLKYVIKVYAATQGKWLFDSGCKVKKLFFTEWVVWCDSVATR